MIRRRHSIKGIGASMFYDPEEPDRNSRNGDDEPVDEVPETSDREVVPEEPLSSKVSEPYDTGYLISLLEDQARTGGHGQQRESAREREVEEQEILSLRDTEPSLADLESFFNTTRAEVAQPPERIVPLEESFVAVLPETKELPPWEEPAVPEGELEMLRPETRPVEEPVPSASGLTPVMPPISYEPHEPVLDDQLTDAKPSDLDSPLGDLKTVSPEQEERAWKRLGEHAFQNLLQEINVLYERITVSLSTRPDVAQRSMDLLSEARDLLLLGNAGDFNLAERRINEAKMMLNQVERTRRWGNTYGWVLFLYELIVLGVLVVALLFDQHIAEWLSLMTGTYTVTNGVAELTKSMVEIFPPWNTMLWGGIGGVVGALYSLHWHVSELQDFDKQYSLWYVVQPLMGLILGGIIHLVIVTGLLALIPGSGSNADPTVAVQWFPILIACLAGFRQKFAYELLDSIMKAFGRQPVSSAKV